jgi:hypothetical protein
MSTVIDWRVCPRCNVRYTEYPAISRRDNDTEICGYCGTEEALVDLLRSRVGRVIPIDVAVREERMEKLIESNRMEKLIKEKGGA